MTTRMEHYGRSLDRCDKALDGYWGHIDDDGPGEQFQAAFDEMEEALNELLWNFYDEELDELVPERAPQPLRALCRIYHLYDASAIDYWTLKEALRELHWVIKREHAVRALVASGLTREDAEQQIWPES